MTIDSRNRKNARTATFVALIALFIIVPLSIMTYKLFYLDYPLASLVPVNSYLLDINMQVDGHGDDISMSTFLPKTDTRQRILNENNTSGIFSLTIDSDETNRLATWSADAVEGHHNVSYSFLVQAKAIQYVIPDDIVIPKSYTDNVSKYLLEEEGVQIGDPLIDKKVQELFPERTANILQIVSRLHRHLQDDFANRKFSGFTDALTALKLGEASCNGKGRLFVAIARKMGIPARLVGGFILNPGSKRTSHQWVELYINSHWVPFDTINNHFASLPSNYLTLYYEDKSLFKHTANVNFQYMFKTRTRMVPRTEAQEKLSESIFSIIHFYSLFEKVGISQDLLKIVLMIPLGAFVVVVFRNVIGMETFGTFLPALIAAAARESGLFWGVIGFVLIIVVSASVRKVLDWLQLLHSPKMAIMLTTVVVVLLSLAVVGAELGMFELAHVSLFPIAILAITAERFAILEAEQGILKSTRITLSTIVVIAACYTVMESIFLQSTILAFPELILIPIALNLWLGRWIGMRFSEFIRFRKLIFGAQNA
ncbi:MAG: UUP1 family membrane protein [Gammaproteobacteria bacterium]|nr:UUP1 family membrane protein [Gammaproteobacteria bacterium]